MEENLLRARRGHDSLENGRHFKGILICIRCEVVGYIASANHCSFESHRVGGWVFDEKRIVISDTLFILQSQGNHGFEDASHFPSILIAKFGIL